VFGEDFESFVVQVIPGRHVTRPATPLRTGYQLVGWFLDADFTKEWNFNNTVGGVNFSLYAKWVALDFTITYFLNGGTNDPRNPHGYTVEDPDINLYCATRDDDKFIAWYEDAMFSRHPVTVIRTSEARDITLYARFLDRRELAFAAEVPAYNRFEGDPKLYLTPDGADMRYEGGQPVMEQGLENQIFLSLFTREGWCGNVFLQQENRVGSDFEATCAGSINRTKLIDIEDSMIRALSSKAFPQIDASVNNSRADNLQIEATVRGGGALSLSREGALWRNQKQKGITITRNEGGA